MDGHELVARLECHLMTIETARLRLRELQEADLCLRDIVLQPGAKTPDNVMKNDMLCHMTEGELAVVQNGKEFTVKKGGVWACANGITTEGTQNKSSAVAIMRVIDLMT
jgi:quercetin dioxygenase-like cupin family protein